MASIKHQNNFTTNLTSDQSAGVTTIPLNSIPSVDPDFYLALDATNVNSHYEVIRVTGKTATNVNCAATSYAHTTAEEVRMVVPAVEMDEITTAKDDGWITVNETWTYASADAPTYTFTISGDKTGKYSAGMKVKLTQPTDGVKYGIITAVSYSDPNTTITLYMGTDYDLDNETITSPYYSTQKAPFGFPLDPSKWSVEYFDSGRNSVENKDSNWAQIPGFALSLPIGVWDLQMSGQAQIRDDNDGYYSADFCLSTSTSSEETFDGRLFASVLGDTGEYLRSNFFKHNVVNIVSAITVYMLWSGYDSTGDNLVNRIDFDDGRILAVCAYL